MFPKWDKVLELEQACQTYLNVKNATMAIIDNKLNTKACPNLK